jgi:hypothetical protein
MHAPAPGRFSTPAKLADAEIRLPGRRYPTLDTVSPSANQAGRNCHRRNPRIDQAATGMVFERRRQPGSDAAENYLVQAGLLRL